MKRGQYWNKANKLLQFYLFSIDVSCLFNLHQLKVTEKCDAYKENTRNDKIQNGKWDKEMPNLKCSFWVWTFGFHRLRSKSTMFNQ